MPFEINVDKFPKDVILILMTELIGHYSIDGDLQYRDDLSQLKYYIPPENPDDVSFDLNKNITSTKLKPTSFIKLDDLLTWMLDNFNLLEKPLSQKGQWLDIDFICRRGALTAILCTPYKNQENWIIFASKYRGTIYLCKYYTKEREDEYIRQKTKYFTIWGFKFEQYMVADQPSHKPNTSISFNECEKFYCVFKANFGDHSLLYEAEIDGISSQQPITDTLIDKTFEFIELKTLSKRLYNEVGTWRYNKYGITRTAKIAAWWCQNYLAGTEKLICGIRNEHIVEMIKEYSTNDLPKLSKPRCKVNKCKMYCKIFLDNVKKIVTKDYNECMYKFFFDASTNVIKYSEEDPNDETYSFLKSWFVEKAENFKTIP